MDPISFDMPINMILVSTNDSVSSASLNESTGESKTVNHLRNESVFCEPSIHLTSSPRAGGDDVEIDDWGASFRTQIPGNVGPDRRRQSHNQCPNCGLGNARRDHAINDASCLMRQRRHGDVDGDDSESLLVGLLRELPIEGSHTSSSLQQQANHTVVNAMAVDDATTTMMLPVTQLTPPTLGHSPLLSPIAAIITTPADECFGSRLHFAANRTPVIDYPLALHSLPNGPRWRSEIVGSTMFLTSFDCTGVVDGQPGSQCCISCRAIRFDPAFQIVQSSITGILPPANAPLEYYSFMGFKTKMKEMNRRIRQLEIAKACLEKELQELKSG